MSKKPILITEQGHVLLHAPSKAAMSDLARRHKNAEGIAVKLFSAVGDGADSLYGALPKPLRGAVESMMARVLRTGLSLAHRSRNGRIGDPGEGANNAVSGALGALGGMGGLPTALLEMPVTTLLVMRAVQSISVQYGFDPADEETRKHCLQILAAAGPLSDDDGVDLGFVTTRVTLTGTTLNAMISRLAPRIAAVFSQRLAARAVPVLGAAAGATINYSFTRYYQEMAHIYFGLRRMAEDSDRPLAELVAELRAEIEGETPEPTDTAA